jgi:hypothetical protein
METKTKAKVLDEKYRISYSIDTSDGRKIIVEEVEYKDAYWRAFQIAGTHRCEVAIARVTTIETPEEFKNYSAFLDDVGDTSEIVTGHVTIGAEHYARDTKLSRYHPNNGWDIPDYLDVEFGELSV